MDLKEVDRGCRRCVCSAELLGLCRLGFEEIELVAQQVEEYLRGIATPDAGLVFAEPHVEEHQVEGVFDGATARLNSRCFAALGVKLLT